MAGYDLIKVNGVNKQKDIDDDLNEIILYTFPLATITVNKDNETIDIRTNQAYTENNLTTFDAVVDKLGTLDAESYVDELANQEFFFEIAEPDLVNPLTINNGITQVDANSSVNTYGLLFLRLKAGSPNTLFQLISLDTLSRTNDDILIKITVNPIVNEATFPLVYNDVEGTTNWEFATGVGGNTGNTITGGETRTSSYLRRNTAISTDPVNFFEADDTVVLCIAVTPLTNGADVLAAMNFREREL